MKRLVFLLLLAASVPSHAQSTIPSWFIKSFKQLELDKKYEIMEYLKPLYLQADFNGDGIKDIVVLVVESKTKKKGMLLIHNNKNQYFLFGAGVKFGNGSDDFKWCGGWRIYNRKIAYETRVNSEGDLLGSKEIKLTRNAFHVYDLEDGVPSSGGIIYWDGKKYIWIQQGE